MSKALATFGWDAAAPLLELALPTFREYAQRHDYDVVVGEQRCSRPASWCKIPLLRDLLTRYDLVLWIDADALVLDSSRDIVDEIPASSFQAFAVTDCGPGNGNAPCLGVWVLRATPRTFVLLDALWEQTDLIEAAYWEQSAMMRLMGWTLELPFAKAHDSQWDRGTHVLSQEWDALPIFPIGYGPARIRHYGGTPFPRRLIDMRHGHCVAAGSTASVPCGPDRTPTALLSAILCLGLALASAGATADERELPFTRVKASVRPLAFYLPQYHPIPENDAFWGPGFTEWTNVTQARPLFRGHRQPNLPGELGFYDLRTAEVRQAQADLARGHGIEGFVYWHYWFAGRRLLERPFQEVLASGQPDFPFCLAWANQSWSGIWHGAADRILVEQTYPGQEDYRAHFAELLPALQDRRYIRVEENPLLIIYRPSEVPDLHGLSETWRREAEKAGLVGLHLVGVDVEEDLANPSPWVPERDGFDGSILVRLVEKHRLIPRHPLLRVRSHARRIETLRRLDELRRRPFEVFPYDEVAPLLVPPSPLSYEAYPSVIPNWDNTPRSGRNGVVLTGSTPERFADHVRDAVRFVSHLPDDHRLIFVKSWNEWAEGNYLEPDARWGRRYLEAFASAIDAGAPRPPSQSAASTLVP